MGDTYLAIKQVGLDLFGNFSFLPSYYEFPECLRAACVPTEGCGGCSSVAVASPSITQAISGVFVGVFSLLAYLAIPAYALATLGSGLATSFIVLTKHKDDQDLIKRKDADERAAEAEDEEAENENASDPEEGKTSEE